MGESERSIMALPSEGMVFKGWRGRRARVLPLPSGRGWVGGLGEVCKRPQPLPLLNDKVPGCHSCWLCWLKTPVLPWWIWSSSCLLHMAILPSFLQVPTQFLGVTPALPTSEGTGPWLFSLPSLLLLKYSMASMSALAHSLAKLAVQSYLSDIL